MRSIKVLTAAALSLVLGGIGLGAAPPASAAPGEQDVATIVSRLQEYYLDQGDEVKIANGIYLGRESEALEYAATLDADGSWPDVDYTDRTSSANGAVWDAYKALYRMLAMAQAYRDPSAAGYEDPELISALDSALAYWDEADPGNTNWWETEIGESIAMGRISIFVGDELSDDALDVTLEHNTGKQDPVGANGAWRTTNYLFEALATKNIENIQAGFDTMVQTVRVDDSGEVNEAVQPDASFWAHGAQLYSEGYGMILFTNVALWADAARGTGLAFSRDNLDTIAFYIVNGTRWMIRGEVGMLYLGYRPAKTIAGVTSQSSEFIEPLTKMVRTDPLYASAYQGLLDSIYGKTRTNGVTGNKYFWRSEFSSQVRDDYGIFTRLNSSRTVGSEYRSTFRPEVGNEIVWGSAGATAIQVNNCEYLDLYPAFDWFHYPGVTAPYVKEQTRGSTGNGGSFTGGVSDGTYGASVYSLDRAATKGSKSYYYFDDEMVALGAGITSGSDAAIHTTVNQAVAKDNASVDGEPVPAGTDSEVVDSPSWAYNDEVGYVFPSDQPVRVSNKAQTGSWLDEDPVTHDAFTLYFDHGVDPDDAGYEYVVLPGKSADEVKAYAGDPAVEVLRNDATVQAVRHAGLGRTMATFYQAGTLDLGEGRTLEVSQPSIVMLDESGDVPVVSLANPSRPGAVVHVTLDGLDGSAGGVFALGSGANLGRTVTAELVPGNEHSTLSASGSGEGSEAALAGDGDDETAWHSADDGTSWLRKELAAGSFLTGVTVAWGDDHAARYLLQTSVDGEEWTDQRLVQDGGGGTEEIALAPTQATYVRLLMLDSSDGNGYSVRELTTRTSVNVALGKAVTASGSVDNAAGNVTDGSMGTRWSANNSDSSWVQVDLGASQPIKTVRLWWEASYALQYRVQVSDDGATWRDAYATTDAGSDGGTDLIDLDETARYVRVQTVKRSTTQYGVSLWELEVFGDDGIAQVPPVPAGRENLALDRPITADSTYNQTAAPKNANDGNPTTRWSSARENAPYTTERWLQVDLEDVRSVNQAVVTWESATSNDYRVEGSVDGQDWTELAHVQKSSGELTNTVDFDEAQVRYVRVIGLPATKYGISIFELELFGGSNLRCDADQAPLERNATGVLSASITPWAASDEVVATSLDDGVASVAGDPRVTDDGQIEVDLSTGESGATWLLLTHADGNEFVRCLVVLSVDKQDLAQVVERADGLDSTRYSPESWRPLIAALEAAKDALRSNDATQTVVDDRVEALTTALDGLVEQGGPEVAVEAESRCLAGRVYVAVRATNAGDAPVDVTLTTDFGERTVAGVQPGKSAYQSFSSRAASIDAGTASVSVTLTDGGATSTQEVAVPARTC
ncbi:discoidin domain-containing protein [Cellulosimicrobium arenosum]|uniref:Discoidin domain-containing protein n=1 Tax=Cellulosimicrobium arenosum TaxID=2708133 RepID=A0A927G7K6_9MICO|nr:discoidin domain-containing protein [Cellulosimicrobium arenosum]MBD8078386.1 discoidin domain-containing protein [Cellulosimicrobium arenosum]